MQNKCLQEWTTQDILHWVDNTLGFSQYKNQFKQIGIDGTILAQITDQDLQRDFGIKIRLQRVKILEGIKLLQKKIADPNQSPISLPQANAAAVAAAAPVAIINNNNNQQMQSLPSSPPVMVSMQPPQMHADIQANNAAQNSGQIIIEDSYQYDPLGARQNLCLKAIQGILLNNTFVIGVSGATLGRHSASNKIVISESYVSRKHCEIKYMREHFYIRDVRSTTGTFVMLRNRVKLDFGLMCQMGLSEFRVTKKLPDMLEMYIFEGPARQTKINVQMDGLTIGRDVSNGFSVTDDSQMSNHHAQIINMGGELYLQDKDSTNKTWLRMSSQGDQSEWKMLRVGDIIKIGSTVFSVEELEDDMVTQMDQQNKKISKSNLKELKDQEIKEDSNKEICKICQQFDVNALWNKCRHLYGCIRCAKKLNACPICRKEGNFTQVFRP